MKIFKYIFLLILIVYMYVSYNIFIKVRNKKDIKKSNRITLNSIIDENLKESSPLTTDEKIYSIIIEDKSNNDLKFKKENFKLNLESKEIDCLILAVTSEHSSSTEREMESFIYWIINQSKKFNNSSICKEFFSFVGKSNTRKYSSANIDHLIRSNLESDYVKNKISSIVNKVLMEYDENKFSGILNMTNYMTLNLGKSKKSPKWHKNYLIDYIVIDNTVYTKYNWSRKKNSYSPKFIELNKEY